jgi:hypothetical protein
VLAAHLLHFEQAASAVEAKLIKKQTIINRAIIFFMIE